MHRSIPTRVEGRPEKVVGEIDRGLVSTAVAILRDAIQADREKVFNSQRLTITTSTLVHFSSSIQASPVNIAAHLE